MIIDPDSLIRALLGGMMIGLSATILLFFNGRIAGVSGVMGTLISEHKPKDVSWRVLFLIGLIVGAAVQLATAGSVPATKMATGWPGLALAGLLVGVGTRMGNGCTSGHGICGIARLSKRSVIATCTFMAIAAITVFFIHHVAGWRNA